MKEDEARKLGHGSISKLTEAIDDSIQKVNDIPVFTIGEISDQTIKNQLLPTLEQAKQRINDIDEVQQKLNAIRNEIILPVKDEIQGTAKANKILSMYALAIGIVGVFFPFYFKLFPSVSMKTDSHLVSQSNEVTIQADTTVAFSQDDWLRFRGILTGEKITNPSSLVIDAQISRINNEIELLISSSRNIDQGKVKELRGKLDGYIDGTITNVTIVSKIMYGIILCERAINNWDKILTVVEFIEQNKLVETPYGNAIKVYKAEAYINLSNSYKGALEIYNSCKIGTSSENSDITILAGDLKRVEKLSNIIERRTKSLELLRKIENTSILIFDSKKLGRDKNLEGKLSANGFKGVSAKGDWGIEFLRPFIYYRDEEFLDSQLFVSVKDLIANDKVQSEYFEKSQSDVIRNAFSGNDKIYLIIVL